MPALGASLLVVAGDLAMAQQHEWSGYVSVEPRLFLDEPSFAEQTRQGASWSGVAAPEFRYVFGDDSSRLTVAPYLRVDQHDRERTHVDLREASWLRTDGAWTLRAGVSTVFWGVTESRHLVDIVNQTDWVEDVDGEAKLGQPMVHIERYTERGSFAMFLLPGFRERTFPADDARLRGPLPIASDRAEYESGARNRRLDLAMRWSHAPGPWDLGLSVFHGTSREPRLVVTPVRQSGPALVPHYDVVTQLGADVQHTRDVWLWKLETILRSGHEGSFAAAVAGFERMFFGVAGSAVDVGVLAEALYDGRGPEAPPAIYGDGIFAGLRIALNDLDGTAVLAGLLSDRDGAGTFTVIEAERRIGERWRVELEARLFSDIGATEPFLHGFRNDSYFTIRAARYF
jgi:hypothetical protein